MRRFILQVLIDTFALLIGLVVLSFIRVPQPFPFGGPETQIPIVTIENSDFRWLALVVTGLLLTTFYMVLRPVIVILTGRLLLWSLGAFQVVVIAIVLWVVARFTPLHIVGADPTILWFLLLAAMLGVIRMVLGAVLGMAGPPSQGEIGGRVWGILDGLPTPRRSALIENLRLQQVYDTLYGYGVDILLEDTPLAPVRAWCQRVLLGEKNPVAGMSTAGKVRTMLQQLGPTYVKLGQIVASRGDALPEEWSTELTKLQSDVRPVPWERARDVMVAELGKDPDEIFGSIDHETLAAASTAQVYRATLPDGTPVVVKVQRPNIVAVTKADLGVIQEIARLGSRRLEVLRKLDLEGIVREFAAGVLVELDYSNEAYNAHRLADDLAKFPTIHIPVIYAAYSTKRVLTEEFVSGIKINNTAGLDAAGVDRAAVGEVFVRSLVKQVLVDGFFHGDPHPGNIMVDPATGRIMYIDFGMVGQLTSAQRLSLLDLIFSITGRDYEGVASAMLGLGRRTKSFDETAYRADMEKVLRRFLEYGEGGSLAAGLNAVMSVVYGSGLRLNNQLTIALKALIQSESTARALSPQIDIAKAAMEESRAAMIDSLNTENVEKVIRKQALRVGRQALQRLPMLESAAWKWVDQFGKGQLTIKIDASDLGEQFGTLNKVGASLTVGAILAGALIGMAIVTVVLMQSPSGAALGPIPGLASLLFIGLLVYALLQVRKFVKVASDPDDDLD
jgi:ubiquinone biosynthesis protein